MGDGHHILIEHTFEVAFRAFFMPQFAAWSATQVRDLEYICLRWILRAIGIHPEGGHGVSP